MNPPVEFKPRRFLQKSPYSPLYYSIILLSTGTAVAIRELIKDVLPGGNCDIIRVDKHPLYIAMYL